MTNIHTKGPVFLIRTFYVPFAQKLRVSAAVQVWMLALTDLSLTTLSWGDMDHENAHF